MREQLSLHVRKWDNAYGPPHTHSHYTSLYVAIHHGNYAYLSGVYSEIDQYGIILPFMKGGIWWERVHTWLGLYLAPGVLTISHSAKITCVVSLHWSQLATHDKSYFGKAVYILYLFLHFFPYLQLPQHLKIQNNHDRHTQS